jgi:hypothetical protein
MAGIESRGFFRTAGGAADIDAPDGAGLAQDDGTAGKGFVIRDVSHTDAGNIGEAFHGWLSSQIMVASEFGDLPICWTF